MILQERRILDRENIDKSIFDYLQSMREMPVSVSSPTVYELLLKLKREEIKNGPHKGVSLFEAANRIISDLTILYGIKELFINPISANIIFDSFKVEFGNENKNTHDIEAKNDKFILYGEAFNVAQSFFQAKRYSALKKLRNSQADAPNKIIMLLYNSDAPKKSLDRNPRPNEFNIPVKIKI
jgi:hypothetical protein